MSKQLKPIFIIGNPRSGTTLLRLILNAHSKFVIPPEAGFAFWLYSQYKNFRYRDLDTFLDDMKSTKKINNWNLDWIELRKFLFKKQPNKYGELINDIYSFYGDSKGMKIKRWGDKNNFYLNHIEDIKEVFPCVQFIHIVRDGRNVACSYKKLNKKQIQSADAPNLPDKIESIASEWKSNIQKIKKSFESFNYDNVLEVRMEDLTASPKTEISKIMSFLGEDFEPSMLEYYKESKIIKSIPKDYLQWKKKNTLPIQNEPVDKYKTILTEEQILRFNKIAKEVLIEYDYSL
ncbi:sulfotransferase [uncultured Draconibacterium sp.]|uniref:sulfotransferase family protein n=1 Tax=uncultured Draconibacterium sp. TaxID=1573823 RepID=UPI003216ABEC